MSDRYTVTIYTAAPGTKLNMEEGKRSSVGHMYYATQINGGNTLSWGFAPKEEYHGHMNAPGKVYRDDVGNYHAPLYARTIEITKEQYEQLNDFGRNPTQYGFSMRYDGLSNSCVDFTWNALNHAHLQSRTLGGLGWRKTDFEGKLLPIDNINAIQTIRPPFPNSELNKEHYNGIWKQFSQNREEMPLEQGTRLADRSRNASADPFDLLVAAAQTNNADLSRQVSQAYAKTEQGQSFLAEGRAENQYQAQLLAQQQALEQQQQNIIAHKPLVRTL